MNIRMKLMFGVISECTLFHMPITAACSGEWVCEVVVWKIQNILNSANFCSQFGLGVRLAKKKSIRINICCKQCVDTYCYNATLPLIYNLLWLFMRLLATKSTFISNTGLAIKSTYLSKMFVKKPTLTQAQCKSCFDIQVNKSCQSLKQISRICNVYLFTIKFTP